MSDQDQLRIKLKSMWIARQNEKHWKGTAEDFKEQVVEEMPEKVSFTEQWDGIKYRVTALRMQQTREFVDEAALKREVGAKVWNKITTPALDKDKLEEAIVTGLVDPVVVAMHTKTMTSSQPFVRFNQRKER